MGRASDGGVEAPGRDRENRARERVVQLVLAAVQFTSILNFETSR